MSKLHTLLLLLPLAGCSGTGDPAQAPPDPAAVAAQRSVTISSGAAVEIEPYLVADTWTIVEFGALW